MRMMPSGVMPARGKISVILLLVQGRQNTVNNLLALGMAITVDTTLLLWLNLVLRFLRQVPRACVRAGRLDVVGLLRRRSFINARYVCFLVFKRFPGYVLTVKFDPYFAICGKTT